MVDYESIYPGAQYTTLSPSYYSEPISNYQENISTLGMALDARTANQLGDLNVKLNPGEKTVEIQGIFGRTMESIPEQHLDEMRRLTKLTGVDPTLHGPLVNASGVQQQGGFTEENRLGAEKQIESAVLRAHKLNPKGKIPVTFHSSQELPEFKPHIMKDGKRIEQGIFVVDEETGQIQPIRDEKRFLPEEGKFTEEKLKFDPEREVEKINKDNWLQRLSRVNQSVQFGENSLDRVNNFSEMDFAKIQSFDTNKIKDSNFKKTIQQLQGEIDYGHVYLKESYRQIRDLFDKAWADSQKPGSNITDDDKNRLKKFANFASGKISKDFENDSNQIEKLREVVDTGLRTLSSIENTPKYFKPLNEFAIEKSAETFANVAENAFNKYGSTAPIISIENPPGGEALSTGEDLKKLVVASRNQLTENLRKKGMSKSQASNVASQMIGATWDVGHINMMRKKGYTEKDVIEQTKKIAPYIKHVHLSDNFGLDHTELPMGMGNVPLKPMMDEIKKAGFKGKKIIEAGNWWEFFSTQGGGNPFLPSIESMDSPIYAMKEGPGWANTGIYGSYYSGHGPINTPVHHQLYQSGFQNMPVELGGEIPGGDRGRFAGGQGQ